MPSFKPKANKKILGSKKTTVTVDSKHQEKMTEFKNIENNIIPELKQECQKLKRKLRKKNITLDQRLDINDKLKKNKKLIFKYEKEKKVY